MAVWGILPDEAFYGQNEKKFTVFFYKNRFQIFQFLFLLQVYFVESTFSFFSFGSHIWLIFTLKLQPIVFVVDKHRVSHDISL